MTDAERQRARRLRLGELARLADRIEQERQIVLAAVGEAISQLLAKERRAARREPNAEIRTLRIELAKTETVLAEVRALIADDGTIIDLPALFTRTTPRPDRPTNDRTVSICCWLAESRCGSNPASPRSQRRRAGSG
jgi:hypothetical protein